MARLVIMAVAALVVPWVFVKTLVREIGRAPKNAWLEALIEIDTIRRAWRARSINPEDWS
jgi:hypothetical protein